MISFLMCSNLVSNETIEVDKQGVLYRFAPADPPTNDFVKNVFPKWEKETFSIFEQVKDPEAIAIDLGAWIGTTAIWLANNFHHVVAVEADTVSLECLQNNLQASECPNVSICRRPIASTGKTVFFGPKEHRLNESISCVKQSANHAEDYPVQAITLKQLVHDYVFQNDEIAARRIGFIKCDIEGGEEEILEDLLYFAYYNKVKVYLSFHIKWWKSKKITDFKHLFEFFNTDCPCADICDYLMRDPFASFLFVPKERSEVLLKTNMPVIIIGYNQPTYIRNMVRQLEPYTSDIIVVDNCSEFQPMLDYYENEYQYTLLRQKVNFGQKVYRKDWIQKLVGDVYLLTDPDLEFNENLPTDFIQKLLDVSDHFKAWKVGFALNIDHPNLRTKLHYGRHTVKSWESDFWKCPVEYGPDRDLAVYMAGVDTTFCLVNKRNEGPQVPADAPEGWSPGGQYRIAGDFTCLHLPWLEDFRSMLQEGEYEGYLKENNTSSWFRITDEER